MSIALIVTRGLGNGTLLGTIKDAVTAGYDISTIIPSVIPPKTGIIGNQSTGAGLSGNRSTGSGIIGNQSTNSGLTGSGWL